MDVTNMKIGDLRAALDKKEITAVQLTEAYLERISGSGCFETVTAEKARAAAQKAQETAVSGKASALCGIPLAISDNICTEDIKTACGSKMLESFIPPYSATAAERLAESGAVILGKTKLDEFSIGSGVPGAVTAVKENLCAGAVCSDTGGEIGMSASTCGITGLRPTYGRVSRYGLAAFSSSMDTIGAVAKDSRGCALILNAIAGFDPKDVHTDKNETPDFSAETGKDIKGLKIAFLGDLPEDGGKAEAEAFFSSCGAEVSSCVIPSLKYAYAAHYIISSAEGSTNLARYDGIKFGHRSGKGDSYGELVKNSRAEGFGNEVKKRILFGTFTLMSGNIKDYFYKAMAVKQKIREEFLYVFEKADAVVFPAQSSICHAAAGLAGIPVVTSGGISVAGRHWEESVIIRIADIFERESKV